MPLSCFPLTVPSPDAPLPSAGSAGAPTCPDFDGTIRALRLPVAHPAALRFLRLAVPSAASVVRSHGAGCGRRRPGDIDHSAPHVAGVCPRETTGPPMFLGNPLVPMPCSLTPAGPSCLALTTGRPGPRPKQNEGYPRLQFRGSITRPQHSLFTLRRADCSATTQNSLPADWLGPPAGLDTRRVPTKGFRDSYITSSSFPKLAWRTLRFEK